MTRIVCRSMKEAVDFAIDREKKARTFYAAWQNRCGDQRVTDLFAFLAAEEQKHKHKIEAIYDNEILQWD